MKAAYTTLAYVSCILACVSAVDLGQAARGVVAITAADAPPANEDMERPTAASGVILSSDGLVLTLAEALPANTNDEQLAVVLPGGARRPASVIAKGTASTAVLLRMQMKETDAIHALPLADSNTVTIGDAVWTAGNSYGAIERDARPTISRGVVSGRYVIPQGSPLVRGKRGSVLSYYRGPVIETDAAVNDGNQGGALLDDAGRLIGLVSLGVAHQRKVGTAVPLTTIISDLQPHLPALTLDRTSAPNSGVGQQLAPIAHNVAQGMVLCYVERPNGPGNPGMINRPAPVTASVPRYQRAQLEEQWNRWYHFQQVAYTDQAIPALVIDADKGLLLTAASNLHGGADSGVTIGAGPEDTSHRWTVHARHRGLDLAVLQCDGPIDATSITFSAKPDLHAGDPLAVVGQHRDGGAYTMTVGVVSATDRRARSSEFALHQTGALMNYGNLGGAVIDLDGEVVGITVMLGPQHQWGINSGVGLFVDSATLLAVLPDLVAGKDQLKMRTVGLGFTLAANQDQPGIAVATVIPETGAHVGGLQSGDIIRGVGTRTIDDLDDLQRALVRQQPGDIVDVHIVRKDQEMTLTITVSVLPEAPDPSPTDSKSKPNLLEMLFGGGKKDE